MKSYGSRVLTVTLLILGCLVAGFGRTEPTASAGPPAQQGAPLAATTRYVCKSGCTFSSISSAVNASNSGDTIKVARGTYSGSVQVRNKSLTIRGGYSTSNWNTQDPATNETIIQAGGGSPAVRLISDSGNHTGTIDGFTITGANTTSGGGGVSVNKYRATISNNVIEGNRAADGAGIRVQDATVSILGNTIRTNTATKNGGGIHVIRGTVTIDDNSIRVNVSQQLGGGGIMVRDNSHFTITNNRIRSNRAVVGGGGIRVEDSEGTIQGNAITSNTASNTGGGLAVVRSDVDVDGNYFSLNNGKKGGGGIQFSLGSTGLISNNELVDNMAGSDPGGGGVHFWQCAPKYGGAPQFVGNTVTDNTSGRVGGGLNIEDSTPLIQDNVITDNHAADQGGGLNITVNSAPTLVGNSIARNTASGKGGGIYGYASSPLIRRNEIVDNQAPTAGGIHLAGCQGLEITNNIIARNKASVEGGGIHLTSNSGGRIVNNTLVDNSLEAINLRNNTKPRIANNILVGHKYGIRVREDAAPTVEYNDAWQNSVRNYDGVGAGAGAISCGPGFVDRPDGDYHLTSASCVIDNGTQTGAPTVDFDGDTRPLDGDGDRNAAWDMGADEFSNSR